MPIRKPLVVDKTLTLDINGSTQRIRMCAFVVNDFGWTEVKGARAGDVVGRTGQGRGGHLVDL